MGKPGLPDLIVCVTPLDPDRTCRGHAEWACIHHIGFCVYCQIETLEKKKAKKSKRMDRNESNEREKEIILRKGSTIRAGQIMSSHILQLLIFYPFLFWINYIDY